MPSPFTQAREEKRTKKLNRRISNTLKAIENDPHGEEKLRKLLVQVDCRDHRLSGKQQARIADAANQHVSLDPVKANTFVATYYPYTSMALGWKHCPEYFDLHNVDFMKKMVRNALPHELQETVQSITKKYIVGPAIELPVWNDHLAYPVAEVENQAIKNIIFNGKDYSTVALQEDKIRSLYPQTAEALKGFAHDAAELIRIATPNTPGHEESRTHVPQETYARQGSIGGFPDPNI